jgi:hypothetical protein
MRLPHYIVTTSLICIFCIAASADVIFTLDAPAQTALPGDNLLFTGLIKNNGSTDLFLNGTSYNVPSFDIILDDTPFFSYAPLFLLAGESYQGGLFDLALTSSVAAGDYFGSFSVTGGADSFAFDAIGTSNFEVTVGSPIATPEPSGSVFLLLPLLIATWLLRQRIE